MGVLTGRKMVEGHKTFLPEPFLRAVIHYRDSSTSALDR